MAKENESRKRVARYFQIYEELKKKITGGDYSPGDMLPFEREICEQYGVDRITVRRSLDMLVRDGLIEKKPGVGSFVRKLVDAKATLRPGSNNLLFVMARNTNDVKSNPSAYNSELFYAVESECRRHGYSLFYSTFDVQDDSLDALCGDNQFFGILLVSYFPKPLLDRCAAEKLPAICLNNRHDGMVSIVADNERGAHEAVSELVRMGHKRIGMLCGRAEYYSNLERVRGFRAGLIDAGITLDPRYMLEGDWTFDTARRSVLSMLDAVPSAQRPTALFCASDLMAIGAMDALGERGIRVPEDMSVIGFDNIVQSRHVLPRLSTVGVDVALMAALAIEQVGKFRGDTAPVPHLITVPSAMERRQSAGHAPGGTK